MKRQAWKKMSSVSDARMNGTLGMRLLFGILTLSASVVMTAFHCATPLSAHAETTVQLSVEGMIPYAGYSTNWMYADGVMAYCANPSMDTPPSGTYAKLPLRPNYPERYAEAVADVFFGFGGPGFDADMWPSSWYDGSPMSDERYVALTHILIADTISSDGNAALSGCNAAFKEWCRFNVIGYGSDGGLINGDATGLRIAGMAAQVPEGFEVYQISTGNKYQSIVSYTPLGEIELLKSSSNSNFSDNNTAYSLSGAVFNIYRDSDCTRLAATIATDEAGHAKSGLLAQGDYYVRESLAPMGYALDERVHHVHVNSGAVAVLQIQDAPQYATAEIVAMKRDPSTDDFWPDTGQAQGTARLEGAQFTIEHYGGIFDSAAQARASGSVARTWVVRTDSHGTAKLDNEHKVSGDAWYTEGDSVVLPLGTLLITETKAPAGYNLDNGTAGQAPETLLYRIAGDGGDSPALAPFIHQKSFDSVVRGDIRIVKEVATNTDPENQELTRIVVQGVRFQVINQNDQPVISPETGEPIAKGEVVCTLVTDECGFASTRGASTNGWRIPEGWAGALAIGTYAIHEVIPENVVQRYQKEHGITLIPIDDFMMSINAQGQYDIPQLVSNRIPQTPLRIIKRDAETGAVITLPCSFIIQNSKGERVTYTDHASGEIIDTWTTGADGIVGLPMKLDEGVYTLHEILAPDGYVLNDAPITFKVDEYRTWENPIVLEFTDMPAKGTINIRKTDEETGSAIAGAEFIVKAACDITTPDGTLRMKAGQVVCVLETNPDGVAETEPLYLGLYSVYESKAPAGYVLDTTEHDAALLYAGQTMPLVRTDVEVSDAPTRIIVQKIDAKTRKPLANAHFRLWPAQSEDASVDSSTVTGANASAGTSSTAATDASSTADSQANPDKDSEVEISDNILEVITDAEGLSIVQGLKPGAYCLQETAAPEGYIFDASTAPVFTFTIDNQGFVDGRTSKTISVENSPIPVAPPTVVETPAAPEPIQAPYAETGNRLVPYIAVAAALATATGAGIVIGIRRLRNQRKSGEYRSYKNN